MHMTRRSLLAAGLGLTQVALLERFAGIKAARAAPMGDGPTKLLTIYLQGGTRQQYVWWPNSDADVDKTVPPHFDFAGEPACFSSKHLKELAPGDGKYPALRTPTFCDPANPGKTGPGLSPLGHSWRHFRLHEQTSVLHGIDQGTNAHGSGYIAAMCGLAGGTYRAPALQSVIANHFYERFRDTRPLPCVAIKSSGMPNPAGLPASSAPILVPSANAIKSSLSAKPEDNAWWKGHSGRHEVASLRFDGSAAGGSVRLTDLEETTLGTVRSLRGQSTSGSDHVLEQIYGAYAGVSKVLARDVADVLAKTKGVEKMGTLEYLASASYTPFEFHFGANFGVKGMDGPLDMTLRVLKSDLATSVHCFLDEVYYDTHNGTHGHKFNAAVLRGQMDVLARLFGEMKLTPAPGRPGKTLLDDTLVLIVSEFGRTWAAGPSQASSDGWSLGDDHHPYTSVTFVGGGIEGNRQIGKFILPHASGADVDVIEESGERARRPPRAADVVATACAIMGLKQGDFFIPGGYGEVTGLRRA